MLPGADWLNSAAGDTDGGELSGRRRGLAGFVQPPVGDGPVPLHPAAVGPPPAHDWRAGAQGAPAMSPATDRY